ncbi:MAG: molybdate ABC transporter permease subunit [Treponemataceae bacterium]
MINWVPFTVSLSLAIWTTVILVVVCFPLAWVFARSKCRWIPFVESFLSLPLVLPPTVLGFYLLISLSPFSPVGAFLKSTFGLTLVFSFPGIVAASCVSALPFMLGALRTGISSVPENLLEASWTLGKSKLETILRIVLPNMKTALLTGIITTFAHTLGEFGVVLMIGGSIPGATKTVSIAIFERVEAQDLSSAHAYAIALVVISYAGTYALNRLQRAGNRRNG